MPDNKIVKIGGVKFNKEDIKSSEKVQKDGKNLNSVFLKDGTHIEYPTQNSKNESVVVLHEKTKTQSSGFGMNMDGEITINYGQPDVIGIGDKEVPTGKYDVEFNRIADAKITGTEKEDDYTLSGCVNTKVDLSQNDGNSDYVQVKDNKSNFYYLGEPKIDERHSDLDKVFESKGNQVELGDNDKAVTKNKNREHWWQSSRVEHKGKGSVKE